MRGAILAAIILVAGSACADGKKQGESARANGNAGGIAPPRAATPEASQGRTAEAPVPPPLLPVPVEPEPGTTGEEPGKGEEPVRAKVQPEVDDSPRTLLEHITLMYGIRPPHAASQLGLDGVIGPPPYAVPLPKPPAAGATEFAREVLISVSKKEILVDDYKVADVTCATASGQACSEAAGKGEARIYRVERSQVGEAGDEYVIVPLLKQLQYFERGRAALLRGLSEKAAAWQSECDVYTVAVDREIPYVVLAQVVHTAAFADLTRLRLVVFDENDSLAYVPLLSPMLDRSMRESVHIVGDDWWRNADKGETAFAAAFLGYAATSAGEDFRGFEDPSLPVCFPGRIAWDRVVDDPEYAATAGRLLEEHIGEVVRTHGGLLGLSPAGGGLPESAPAPTPADPKGKAAAADLRVPGGGGKTGPGPLPGGKLPFVIPFLHVTPGSYTLALKTLDDVVMEAVELPAGETGKLHEHLSRAGGNLIALSAESDIGVSRLVSVMDAVRFRCLVYAMSGKCKKQEPLFPTVYLFVAPGDQFKALAPAEDEPGERKGGEDGAAGKKDGEKRGEEGGGDAGGGEKKAAAQAGAERPAGGEEKEPPGGQEKGQPAGAEKGQP